MTTTEGNNRTEKNNTATIAYTEWENTLFQCCLDVTVHRSRWRFYVFSLCGCCLCVLSNNRVGEMEIVTSLASGRQTQYCLQQ